MGQMESTPLAVAGQAGLVATAALEQMSKQVRTAIPAAALKLAAEAAGAAVAGAAVARMVRPVLKLPIQIRAQAARAVTTPQAQVRVLQVRQVAAVVRSAPLAAAVVVQVPILQQNRLLPVPVVPERIGMVRHVLPLDCLTVVPVVVEVVVGQ